MIVRSGNWIQGELCMSKLETHLKTALKNVTQSKKLIEKQLDKEDNNPKKPLYLRDYKIELFNLQLRLKDMIRNLDNIK